MSITNLLAEIDLQIKNNVAKSNNNPKYKNQNCKHFQIFVLGIGYFGGDMASIVSHLTCQQKCGSLILSACLFFFWEGE